MEDLENMTGREEETSLPETDPHTAEPDFSSFTAHAAEPEAAAEESVFEKEPAQEEAAAAEESAPAQESEPASTEYHYSRPDAGRNFDTYYNGNRIVEEKKPVYEYYDSPYTSATYSHDFTRTETDDRPRKVKRERKKGGGRAWIALLCCVLSLLSGFGGAWFYNKHFGGGTAVIYKTPDGSPSSEIVAASSIADLVALCKPSVVEINCDVITSNGFFGQSHGTAAGSGVIITADGYIVTNYHVIDGAQNVSVISALGKTYAASIYGYDKENDLAVIKINAKDLTPAVIADSSQSSVGDYVFAIGNPLGTLGGSVTEGIISALDREITVEGQPMTLIQTSAAVNPGNSGGGLFNAAGELVGVVNAKSIGEDVEGIGFAIPSNLVKDTVENILSQGGQVVTNPGPVLGVTIIEIDNEEAANQYKVDRLGVYIVGITEGLGAEAAGLQAGDYIVSIDEIAIRTSSDVTSYIKTKETGDTVSVQIIRAGRMLQFEVELMESAG